MGAGVQRWWRDINDGNRRKAEECRVWSEEQQRLSLRVRSILTEDGIEMRYVCYNHVCAPGFGKDV